METGKQKSIVSAETDGNATKTYRRPAAADLIYIYALNYYYNGDLINGAEYLKKVLQIDKNHIKAKDIYVKLQQLKGKTEEGGKLFKLGQFVEAKIAYTEALQIDLLNKNINSTLYYNRALVNSKLENLEESIADCTQALQINTKYTEAVLLRAKCYNNLQWYHESLEDYEIALTIEQECIDNFGQNKKNISNYEKVKNEYEKLKRFKETKEKGNLLLEAGKFEESKDLYTKALQFKNLDKGMYSKLYYDRALVNFKMKNFPESIADCFKAIKIYENNTEAIFLRAECYNLMKNYIQWIQDCDIALKISANYLKCKCLKAECLVFLKRIKEAQRIVNKTMKSDLNSADLHYIYGLCLFYKDNLIESISHFKKSLRLLPDHTKAQAMFTKSNSLKEKRQQGNDLCKSGKYKTARTVYTEALKIYPFSPFITCNLYCERALVNSKLGNLQDAIEDCNKALEVNANHFKALLFRANCYNDLKEYQKCINDCDRGLRINAKYLEFKFLKAECLVLLGRIKEAEKIIEEAVKLNPNSQSTEALYVNGLCLYYNDDLEKCIDKFKQVIQVNPGHVKVKAMLMKSETLKEQREQGKDLFKSGKFIEAQILCTETLKIDPSNSVINSKLYYNRGLTNLKLENLQESIRDCTKAIEINNLYEKAILLRAKCYIALKEYQKCIDDCNRGLTINSKSSEFIFLKEDSLTLLNLINKGDNVDEETMKRNSNSQSIEALYESGLHLYYNDNLDKCINNFEQTLQINPDHVKAKEIYSKSKSLKDKREKANNLFKSGKFEEAQLLYTEVLKIDPTNYVINSKLYFNRGLMNSKLGNLEKSIEDCTKALEINNTYHKALFLRANCYNDLKEYQKCIDDCDRGLKSNPEYLGFKFLKAESLILLGRILEGQKLLEEAMKMIPNSRSVEALYANGLCLYYSDDLVKCINNFEEILQKDPDHVKAEAMHMKSITFKDKRQKANNLYKSGKFKEAQLLYSEVLKIDPTNYVINSKLYFNRGLMNSKLGNLEKSIEDCTKALEIHNTYHKALFLRANCYNDLKEYQKCIDDCDRVLKINSKYLEFQFLKAECLILLGRINVAEKIVEEAIKLNPNSQSTEALYVNGLCLYYNDDLEKCIDKFKQVIQVNPGHVKVKAMLMKSETLKEQREQGKDLFKSGKFIEAQILCTETLKIDPSNSVINSKLYYNRGLTNLKLENLQESIRDCTKAIEINNLYEKAILLRAKCYIALKEYQKCIDDCNRGLTINSKSSEFIFLKEDSLTLLNLINKGDNVDEETMKRNSNSQSIEALYECGLHLYYNDDLDKSINNFEQILQINPDHVKAKEIYSKSKSLKDKREKANNLFKSGKFEEAQLLYTEVLKIDPTNYVINSKLYFNRGLMNSKLGNLEKSIEDCTKALEINNTYHKALFLRANCYNDLKEYQKCIDDCDRGLKINSEYLGFKFLKAESLILLGRILEGQKLLEEAMKMNPYSRSVEALYANGLCLYYSDDLINCINNFEEILQKDPDHVKAKAMHIKSKAFMGKREHGKIFYNSGKFKEVQILITEALKIDPSNSIINIKLYYNRALMNSKLKNFNESIEDCTKALEVNNLYHKALLLRAKCYYDLEMYEECIMDCVAALNIERTKEVESLLDKAKLAYINFDQKDYYELLGVTRFATEKEIKVAYKKKALLYHPDKHQGDTIKKLYEAKFKKILEAFTVLSDPEKRMEYTLKEA